MCIGESCVTTLDTSSTLSEPPFVTTAEKIAHSVLKSLFRKSLKPVKTKTLTTVRYTIQVFFYLRAVSFSVTTVALPDLGSEIKRILRRTKSLLDIAEVAVIFSGNMS